MANYSLVYKENSDFVLKIVTSEEEKFEVHEDLQWVEGPLTLDPNLTSAEYSYSDGIIKRRPIPVVTYADKRKIDYPEISVQLDALWHDMNSGIIPGKESSDWFQMISEIKELHPKE